MTDLNCDVAVIDAGTAGLAAERSARRSGATTLLVDDRFAGTTCASVGCMLSKLLIAAADAAHAVRRASIFGLVAQDPVVDGAAVMARIRGARDKFVAGVKSSFEKLPAGVTVQGRARFVDCTTLQLEDGSRISASAIVIATGAKTSIPAGFEDVRDSILTNETIFDLPNLPTSIGVVGAGPLGLELAQALVRLGVEVMVFDRGKTLGAFVDQVVAEDFRRILSEELPITLAVRLAAKPDDDGVLLSWTGAENGERRFDRLLMAAGSSPQLKGSTSTRPESSSTSMALPSSIAIPCNAATRRSSSPGMPTMIARCCTRRRPRERSPGATPHPSRTSRTANARCRCRSCSPIRHSP